MNIAKFFRSKSTGTPETREGRGTREADAAIREALAGRIPMLEMHRAIMAAQVFVPLAEPPVVDGGYMKGWHPALYVEGGDEFLVVYTDKELLHDFNTANPEYSYTYMTDTAWVLTVLPPNRGLAFNVGGGKTNCVLWPAEGIAEYRRENEIKEFEPTNTLEVYLQRGCAGEISTEESLPVLVEADIYVPSAAEFEENLSGFVPFVFNPYGQTLAAAFTNPKLMDIYKDRMKGSVVMKGGELLSTLAPGFGLVINPGYRIGMEIPEPIIKDIVRKFVRKTRMRAKSRTRGAAVSQAECSRRKRSPTSACTRTEMARLSAGAWRTMQVSSGG